MLLRCFWRFVNNFGLWWTGVVSIVEHLLEDGRDELWFEVLLEGEDVSNHSDCVATSQA